MGWPRRPMLWTPAVVVPRPSQAAKNPLSDPHPTRSPNRRLTAPRRPLRAARPEHGRRMECPQMGWPHNPMLWTPAVVVPRRLRRPRNRLRRPCKGVSVGVVLRVFTLSPPLDKRNLT